MLVKWIVTTPLVATLTVTLWTVFLLTVTLSTGAVAEQAADEPDRPAGAAEIASPAESSDASSDSESDAERRPQSRRGGQQRGRPGGRMGGRFGGRMGGPMGRFDESTPAIGAPLPSIAAYDADGKAMNLSDLKGSFSVIIFGCLT